MWSLTITQLSENTVLPSKKYKTDFGLYFKWVLPHESGSKVN